MYTCVTCACVCFGHRSSNYASSKHLLTFPSMASFAQLASSSFEKFTNPNPLDLPVSLSYMILTETKVSSRFCTVFSILKNS